MNDLCVDKRQNFKMIVKRNFKKIYSQPIYRVLLLIFGLPTFLFLIIKQLLFKSDSNYKIMKNELDNKMLNKKIKEQIYSKVFESEKSKIEYLNLKCSRKKLLKNVDKITNKKYLEIYNEELQKLEKINNVHETKLINAYYNLLDSNIFFILSILSSVIMYVVIIIYSKPYLKYITERVVMMFFVMMGVVTLVFTILYISPMDPAQNILGEDATEEKIAEFEKIYGLDEPYIVQLAITFKKLITFDFGNSFIGNENVIYSITTRFPITLQLAFASLFVGVIIAIPAGIISAIKQYSSFDYCFMFLALLGLSLPNFWLALVMILNFSIKLDWLPAMYDVNNLLTLIMPAIVLGTDLAASCARMTRSSMLEVKNQDYVLTARAKGLSEKRVVIKHILGNAMIPIVTVVGMQFGGLLGGSTVTEKIFNVNGLGKYIVEKQFIPDIPVVLAGVVYIAIVISIVNLLVDILYAFLDPRIKSKIKNY